MPLFKTGSIRNNGRIGIVSKQYTHGDRSWWQAARFGMFIHWGIYSIPARGEWMQTFEKVPAEKYAEYADHFDPDRFEPEKWAKLAKAAGMKYVVLTAKHHDGFCMFDSAYTDFKAKRDYVREIFEAFRAEGLRTGVYYSLLDWHHDQFTVDHNHPLRDLDWAELNKTRNQHLYCEYMRNQVTELLTKYGQIDIIWFDFTYARPGGKYPEEWEAEELLKLVRKLNPSILINGRLGLEGAGDFMTPEQYIPADGIRDQAGELLPWEGCQTFSGAWGYHRDETTWKTPHQLIAMLISHVARGGNLLLNVGPDARGRFDRRAVSALEVLARWMDEHSDSIYNCTIAPSEFPEPDNCMYTWNPATKKLYLHLMSYPVKFAFLPGLFGKVKFARFLNDHSEVKMLPPPEKHGNMTPQVSPDTLTLQLPAIAPDVTIPVIELSL